jgi:geranylgeranyl diphosphate synthase type II
MVEFIHVRKTGALILAARARRRLIGGAREAALRRLTRYGERLGLAFQVADDILDAEAPTSVTARRWARRGAAQGHLSGGARPAGAKQRARELLEQALAALDRFEARRPAARHRPSGGRPRRRAVSGETRAHRQAAGRSRPRRQPERARRC